MDQLQSTDVDHGERLPSKYSSTTALDCPEEEIMLKSDRPGLTIAEMAKQTGRSISDVTQYLKVLGHNGPLKKTTPIGPPFFTASVLHLLPSWQPNE